MSCLRKEVDLIWIWNRKVYIQIPQRYRRRTYSDWGDDQSNVEDFFENSEDEIKSTLDDALKIHVIV